LRKAYLVERRRAATFAERRLAFRHLFADESDLYANPIREQQSAARCRGDWDYDHLDDVGDLEE